MADTHITAPTRIIEVEGDRFAYRRQYPDRFLKHAIQFLAE